jgi:hypothetical protein
MTGKGSTPRPLSVPQDEYADRWAAIDWAAHRDEQETRSTQGDEQQDG